jgi:adenylyltransferase/sulfurtransferase
VRRDADCPACGTRELRELIDYDEFCGVRPRTTVPVSELSTRPLTGHRARVMHDITPRELAERIGRSERLDIVDVREPYEWRIARIPGARLVPLAEIATAEEFATDREIVLYCHHGHRSWTAGQILLARGYDRVWNLTGGIARWSAEVDPSVPTY